MSTQVWHVSESRPIWPYRYSTQALSSIGLRLFSHEDLSKEDPWVTDFEYGDLPQENLKPEFHFDVDLAVVEEETGLGRQDILMSVLVRDPSLQAVWVAQSWTLEEIPATWNLPNEILDRLGWQRNITLEVILSPRQHLDAESQIAHSPGDVVARRAFVIRINDSGEDFPIQEVSPEYFLERGFPKRTVWIIDWSGVDQDVLDGPVSEALTVILNRDECERLLRLSSGNTLGNALWASWSSEILTEICVVALENADEAPKNKNSLLASVCDTLQYGQKLSFEEIKAKATNQFTGFPFVRSRVQNSISLGDELLRIDLAKESS